MFISNQQFSVISVTIVVMVRIQMHSQDIEKELGLSREKLIRMALLLGSDYTEGIR